MAEREAVDDDFVRVKETCPVEHGIKKVDVNASTDKICHTFDYDERNDVDLMKFRAVLLKDGPSNSSILQVVGDSGTSFDESALDRAKRILADHITKTAFIEYGYTYQHRDANWLVAEYLEDHPEAGERVITNAVDACFDAVKTGEWFYSPHPKHCVVVKGDPPTKFGDDVWVSDGVMQPGDRMICFEGGAQALRQCVNMLLSGINVTVVTDLRNASRFSAARLLSQLKQKGRLSQHEDARIQEQIERLFHGKVDLGLITIA